MKEFEKLGMDCGIGVEIKPSFSPPKENEKAKAKRSSYVGLELASLRKFCQPN